MFVQSSAVGRSQAVGRSEVTVPIDQHSEAGLMAAVDEFHEITRSTEAAGRGEVRGDLIAPRSVKWMLGDRQVADACSPGRCSMIS